jgi:hypothetical protein
MRVKPILFGVVVVIVFMSVVVISQAAGYWPTSGKVTTSGELVNPSADDVETIKGWMTLNQISESYAVPLIEILQKFSLPDDTSGETAIKDLESETFEVTILREWLVSRMNGEVPAMATPVSTEQSSQIAVSPTQEATISIPLQPTVDITETHIAPEKTITGKTTFQELIDWGLGIKVIESVIGSPFPGGEIIIKDYVTGLGMEFSPVKTTLQEALDKMN